MSEPKPEAGVRIRGVLAWLLLLSSGSLGGCTASPAVIFKPVPPLDTTPIIAAGQARWAERKASCESYFYDREVMPNLNGATAPGGGIVTVAIVDDQPTFRWYLGTNAQTGGTSNGGSGGEPSSDGRLTGAAGTGAFPMPIEWIEEGASLGSHPGAPPAETVEQLWDECESALAAPGAGPIGNLVFDEEGAPTMCVVGIPSCPGSGPGAMGGAMGCVGGVQLDGFSCGTLQPPNLPADGGADATTDAETDAQ